MAKRKSVDLPTPDPTVPSLSDTRPLFIDNRSANTLDRAIVQHLQTLRGEQKMLWEVCIASCFFNLPGFDLIAEELAKVDQIRLLLGAEPVPESLRPRRRPEDPPEPLYTQSQVAQSLVQLDEGLRQSRDLLPFDAATEEAVRRLLDLLHRGKINVRRYTREYLHAKAFLFRVVGGGMLVGSSNLTYGGLRRNLELNLGNYMDPVVDKVERWYDELWEQAEPFDLAAVFDELMAEFPPYLIYLRVLFELYAQELDEEQEASGDIPVTQFQQHGIWRALKILKKYGGVVIADGVGLGKTYMAGEIIKQYRQRRQRVLLICPAALRDSTWKDFRQQFELFIESVSYEQLARDRQLGGEEAHLGSNLEEYQLVIVDEAHNYRNPDAKARAAVMRRLLLGPRRDLVLLTATPVNNSLWDLYHLLRFFIKQDAVLADRGVLSIRERFMDAMNEDPFSLSPDLLYPVIDATTVKRTRQFIKRHYENDLITLPGGRRVPIKFPSPRASSIKYDLDSVLPGFFAEVEDALMPAHGQPRLRMARYMPENYLLATGSNDGDTALVGLLRSGLLKRFESSAYAFAKTTRKMVSEHNQFLDMLERGIVARKELFRELSAAEDEDEIEELLEATEHAVPAEGYDVKVLRKHVEEDRDILEALCHKAERVRMENDPKLTALIEELERIAEQAKREGIDEEDRRQKRKVLVFSFYADTVNWIEDLLRVRLETDKRLATYSGRMASVAGNESRHGITRENAVHGFAPETTHAPPGKPGEERDKYDILICTDVLAEGMNLQQCRNIINYDLPWNPMRLVQRHGRIDRIGSRHDDVFLRTFFPDKQLNRLLDLELRVKRKLAQAAYSVGVETPPIEGGAEGLQSFAETREEIEKLKDGNPTLFELGGTAAAAQSGEEYRQELRQALLRQGDEIRTLPWKAGSGMVKGNRRGHFFCAKVGERIYTRFVPFAGDGSAAEIVSELGTCLRIIECRPETARVMPLDLKQTAYSAWERARNHIFDSWEYETDPANLQPRVSKFNRSLADYLRENPPADVPQRDLERALESIEAPASRREEALLKDAFERDYPAAAIRSKAVVEAVARIGLEPFAPPAPLPPVVPEDVHLICWMAIEAQN